MKLAIVLLSLAAFVAAELAEEIPEYNPVFGYIENIGIPEAERIRKQEEEEMKNPLLRIHNGNTVSLGQVPFQAGLIGFVSGSNNQGVCGASLITRRVLSTAAHCWNDGQSQMSSFTVVLGSVRLFSGGTRINTNNVVMHPNWNPRLIRDDVAVIRLPSDVSLNNNIQTIALASGSSSYSGSRAFVAGFGMTGNNNAISNNQALSRGQMTVITNSECQRQFGSTVQSSNICARAAGFASTCRGDSGGPLYLVNNNVNTLIGITSFGASNIVGGCQSGLPAAFARVTSYASWFRQFM